MQCTQVYRFGRYFNIVPTCYERSPSKNRNFFRKAKAFGSKDLLLADGRHNLTLPIAIKLTNYIHNVLRLYENILKPTFRWARTFEIGVVL